MNPTTGASTQPACYLNGKLVSAIAVDYGGYAGTLQVSQLAGATVSSGCARGGQPCGRCPAAGAVRRPTARRSAGGAS